MKALFQWLNTVLFMRRTVFPEAKETSAVLRLAKTCLSIPAVMIDGFLCVAFAWFAFSQSFLGGDEAAKFIDPVWKFWLNWVIGGLAIICSNLQTFRSRTYAEHRAEKAKGNTSVWERSQAEPQIKP